MARIISASIDLNKIDKLKIQTTDKNGYPFKNGAKYLNISISVNDESDKYGNDASIQLAQTQQEREAGKEKIYLGNGKTVWKNESQSTDKQPVDNSETDDLPF